MHSGVLFCFFQKRNLNLFTTSFLSVGRHFSGSHRLTVGGIREGETCCVFVGFEIIFYHADLTDEMLLVTLVNFCDKLFLCSKGDEDAAAAAAEDITRRRVWDTGVVAEYPRGWARCVGSDVCDVPIWSLRGTAAS